MKNIVVEKPGVGMCTIKSDKELSNSKEYAIKSLAAIQILCMNPNQDDKYPEMINILKKSMDDIYLLYSSKKEKTDVEQSGYFS